jgi:multiple sugar transport system permease protein
MSSETLADRITWPEESDAVSPRPRRWLPFSPWHLFLLPFSLVMLLPLIWMVVTSLQTQTESLRFPPTLLPKSLEFSNYPHALSAAPFGRWVLNTAIYTVAVVVSNL